MVLAGGTTLGLGRSLESVCTNSAMGSQVIWLMSCGLGI